MQCHEDVLLRRFVNVPFVVYWICILHFECLLGTCKQSTYCHLPVVLVVKVLSVIPLQNFWCDLHKNNLLDVCMLFLFFLAQTEQWFPIYMIVAICNLDKVKNQDNAGQQPPLWVVTGQSWHLCSSSLWSHLHLFACWPVLHSHFCLKKKTNK